MGPGFLKAVYQEAMEIELGLRAVPNVPQPELQVRYKGRPLKKKYNPDFACYEKIIVELKAIEGLTNHDEAQLFNYLNATKFELGLYSILVRAVNSNGAEESTRNSETKGNSIYFGFLSA